MRILLTSGLVLLATSPTLAAATDWQQVTPDVRVRMISNDVLTSAGTTLIAIEIDMPASSKTYWRVPGETGIPTELDLAGSTGIAGHEILWPYPEIDTTTGYVDFAYYGPTVLPVEVEVVGDTPRVAATIVMGVCSEICVPVSARFSLSLDFTEPDRGQRLRIDQAVSEAPLDWEGPVEPIGAVSYDTATNALTVAVVDDVLDPSSLIADTGDIGILLGAPQKSPDERIIRLSLLGNSEARGLEGEPVQLTFMTPMGPFEISRRVTAPVSASAGQ